MSMSSFTAALALGLCAIASAVTVEIPMRDGVTLHTQLDFPPFPATKLAAIMERSPYGQNKEELISLVLGELLGYVALRQDQRGTGGSGGTFSVWHDSCNDTYDTLDWITNQTWSNGHVFTTGVSADAIDECACESCKRERFYVCPLTQPPSTDMTLPHMHPALRAQFFIFGGTTGGKGAPAPVVKISSSPCNFQGRCSNFTTTPPPLPSIRNVLPRRGLPRGAYRGLAEVNSSQGRARA